MQEGEEAIIYVSPEYGFGQNPPAGIPEWSGLIYEIKLLSLE